MSDKDIERQIYDDCNRIASVIEPLHLSEARVGRALANLLAETCFEAGSKIEDVLLLVMRFHERYAAVGERVGER
jgi:hypothetical protein